MLAICAVLFVLIIVVLTIYVYRICKKYIRYSENRPIIARLKADLSKIEPRVAELEIYPSTESYTYDKKIIYLCLRDSNGNVYDYNMLMYVTLHELGHFFSPVVDPQHKSEEFTDTFKMYLDKATAAKIYDPSKPLIKNYCGVVPT
jgi:hypothetical protein